MADSQLGWSEAQWEKVNNAVAESFAKASVASAFLPCYGPLGGSAETVRDSQLRGLANDIKVRDTGTLRFFNLTVKVRLSSEQIADDSLSSALLAFRRAANTLAQVEDEIVFNGFDEDLTKTRTERYQRALSEPDGRQTFQTDLGTDAERAERVGRAHFVVVSGPPQIAGLAASPEVSKDPDEKVAAAANLRGLVVSRGGAPVSSKPGKNGQDLVNLVAKAIGELEASANPSPFACVLGRKVFEVAQTPEQNSMVLPADRITPMLGGPLLRCGSMLPNHGVVVSLAGDAVDIVVAAPPTAQFLQRTEKAEYLFRVYERFVLRIKDKLLAPVQAFVLYT